MVRKLHIAVIGYNEDRCTEKAKTIAYEVGKEIAVSGAILVCGGLGGVMEYACKGAKEYNGTTVGIIPQEDPSFANKYCDIVICTGFGLARDFIVAASADGIIAIGGGVGTLIELGVGYMIKKTIIAMSGSGGISDIYGGRYLDERKNIPVIFANEPHHAVQMIFSKNTHNHYHDSTNL